MARPESRSSTRQASRIKLFRTASPSRSLTSKTSLSNMTSASLYSDSSLAFYEHHCDRPSSAQSFPAQPRHHASLREDNRMDVFRPTTELEFEELPLAVRRKYFSTHERLRLAQKSNSSSWTTDHELSAPKLITKRSVAHRRGMKPPTLDARQNYPANSRRPRKLSRPVDSSSPSANDVSWFIASPSPDRMGRDDKLVREGQVNLAGRLQDRVIMDAADEAWSKASRYKDRALTPVDRTLSPPYTTRKSVESSISGSNKRSSISKAMYESFRWMDEEEDLDLRLTLDDYHANIDGVVLPSAGSIRRPSYRRHMSISKLPFGRVPTSPQARPTHTRQKSKTMSVMGSKHLVKDSVSSIDPHATHYQDPEARIKLRVYLASPQKFDEAIEFGFPSADGVVDVAEPEDQPLQSQSKGCPTLESTLPDFAHSFLYDEAVSLFGDDVSTADPDSPVTPSGEFAEFAKYHGLQPALLEKRSNSLNDFSHLGLGASIKKPSYHKPKGSYTHSTAGSREMTLRMTLTRPDLRADDSTLYGWQDQASMASESRCRSPLEESPLALEALSMEKMGPFGGVDGWGPPEKENGVVKRLWKRVKSTPRKSY
ncbi:MAG: hypothetical protein M1818_000740 [Claussenomyces sp. TS43310]|nr:MAG: hypothetical protein M1818_000740 [Claussenomyces sp. TS43310]